MPFFSRKGHSLWLSILAAITMGSLHTWAEDSRSMFDGQTLTGWEGDPEVWSATERVIRGEYHGLRTQNTFLLWRGGQPQNFQLSFKARLYSGNSGVQYRSRELGRFAVAGYQCEIDNTPAHAGFLYEERGRKFLAYFGQTVELPEHGFRHVLSVETSPAELLRQVHFADAGWNDYRIVAEGPHLAHFVNGVKTVEVNDYAVTPSPERGLIALQVHAGWGMRVEFKDLRIVMLPLATPSLAPAVP